jgi:hypothetical protein
MFIVEFIRFAYPSTIAICLANVNFPIHFLYYIQMFKSRLTDEFVLSSLLVECFVRALISNTVETVNDELPGAEKAQFFKQSLHHRIDDAFASSSRKRVFVPVQLPVRQITIRDTFTLTRKLSLKERPPHGWLALASSGWTASACRIGRRVLIVLAGGARPPKKLKWETALA